jgi:hypothetical protein
LRRWWQSINQTSEACLRPTDKLFVVDGTPRPAAYIAMQICQLSVEDATKYLVETFFDGYKGAFKITPTTRGAFELKIRLYCEASALRILQTEKEKDSRYFDLVAEFMKLILPPTPSGMLVKLGAVKSAMKNIEELISERKELSLGSQLVCRHRAR